MNKPQPRGLTFVVTSDLEKLLSAVHRKVLDCPLAIEGLTRVGLQHTAVELMGALRGLDERAVRALLVAVIAERRAREEASRRAPD
jgi:hypothetical protein